MSKLSLEELSNRIAEDVDIDNLFRYQVEIGNILHNEYSGDKNEFNKGVVIAANNALDVCKKRIDIISERNKILTNEANRVNHNFRIASKKVLTKSTYNIILNNAYKTIKEAASFIRESDYINIE